jgi:predicted SAM-dependent methyltransferase
MTSQPQFSTVILGHLSAQERKSLVARAFTALRPGGAVRVYGPMPYAERLDLLESMAEAGFDGASMSPLASSNTLVIGRKVV